MMQRGVRRGYLCLFATAAVLCAAPVDRAAVKPGRYIEDVKQLAAPEMRGRGTGMPELAKAADYIARQFKSAGLRPLDGKSYLQAFNVTVNARPGKANRVEVAHGENKRALKLREEFIPFNFSAVGAASAQLVFAGYGITAREYGYDDYEGVDVKDKFVVILRHEPQEFDDKSVFAGRVFTEHAQFFSKAVNAKLHGARGVILINDAASHTGDDQLEKFSGLVGPGNPGILFVQVKAEVAEEWFRTAGKSLADLQSGIDKDLAPRSFAFPAAIRANVSVDIHRESRSVNNVAGYLPGETGEYLVIGAHYDHLGLGEQFSMSPSEAGTPHPGADDNASGTAGVLELARMLSGKQHKRGFLFLAFAGEELGLLGSNYYVNNPKLPLKDAVAMINLDMIGRVREGKVYVGGAGTGTTFKSLLDKLGPRYDLHLDLTEQAGYGSSDHFSFTTKQVPVLFFFSGLHSDYHRPSDTWEKIDIKETSRLLALVADVATTLADEPGRPDYVRVAPPAGHAGAGGGAGGYGAYFGSVPDFTEIPDGVRFADVRDASPAAKAGLKAGDVLVEFDGKPVKNLYDFTYALRSKKAGDEVSVKVLRGGAAIEAKVTLEQRR